MDVVRKLLALLSAALAAAAVLGLAAAAVAGFGAVALPVLLMLALVYGWMLYAYLHYRSGRQDELLYLLAAAAESSAPLGPALRAYLRDRPERGWRKFWAALLLFFVLPGYYWVRHRRDGYDRKLARVADQLEQGLPLHEALEAAPGVAAPGTVLAVAVGESTGKLALSLRRAAAGRLATAWLEALPRLLYPLALLLFLVAVSGFWLTYLLPRMERIFADFGIELPALTTLLANAGAFLAEYDWAVALAFQGVVVLVVLPWLSPGLCWYVPVLGRLYRMSVQGRVLKMLAVLLEAGKPLPEALEVLARSGAFPGSVLRRLDAARAAAEQGEPLADSLRRGGLLPAAMAPLVGAAGRAQNLPWALAELGDRLSDRASVGVRRLSLAVFPAAVLAVGLVVGVVVLGMFLPLVKLITEMA